MKPSPLRYALLLNGSTIQTWEAKALAELEKLNPAPKLSLILYRKEMEEYSPKKTSWFSRIKKIGWNRLGYHYFFKYFCRPEAYNFEDFSKHFEKIPSLTVEPVKKGKWAEHFDEATLNKVREANPDFILRFGFNILSGEILKIPRYGVWSFHHDDEEKYRGSPPGFWEIYNGDPVTGSMLQQLTEKLDSGIVLKKGYFKTLSHSYTANLNQILMESSKWPAAVCKTLMQETNSFPSLPTSTSAPLYRVPSNSQVLFFMLRLCVNNFKNRIANWFTSEKWDVAILPRPIEEALDQNFLSNFFDLYLSNNKAFYADPFGVQGSNGIQVLTEKYDYKTGQGSLCSLSLFSGEKEESALKGFPAGQHLSYPFLYHENEKSYCIPESLASNEIALFEATKFPNEWKKLGVLVKNFRGVDATLFFHNNKYWLFCTNEEDGPRSNLYLFHANSLEGPYTPHLLNPVKTDIRSARPAGTPFYIQGKLYRPAQDCSKTYGGAIVLNEITELTEDRFSESAVKTLGPLPGTSFSAGMHTLSRCGNFTLIDGKAHRFNLYAFFRVLKLRFGNSNV